MSLFKYQSIYFSFLFMMYACTPGKEHANREQGHNSAGYESSSAQTFNYSIPQPRAYVNDFENLYTTSERNTLENLLGDFEKRTTVQIALITIDSAMTSRDSLDSFTVKIAKAWGVGQKDRNNGVTIGISKFHRKMRIVNGYGIEKILTDTETKEIIDSYFIPGFRQGEYYNGTLKGIKALMEIISDRYK